MQSFKASLERKIFQPAVEVERKSLAVEKTTAEDLNEILIKIYTQVIKISPANVRAYYLRGQIHEILGRTKHARRDMLMASKIAPNSTMGYKIPLPDLKSTGEIHFDQCVANLGIGDHALALTHINLAIKANPLISKYYLKRYQLYIKLCSYENAIDDITNVIRLSSGRISIHYTLRGQAFALLGDMTAAIEDYSQAILINPEDPELFLDRANLFLKEQDYFRAFLDYKNLVEFPDSNKLFSQEDENSLLLVFKAVAFILDIYRKGLASKDPKFYLDDASRLVKLGKREDASFNLIVANLLASVDMFNYTKVTLKAESELQSTIIDTKKTVRKKIKEVKKPLITSEKKKQVINLHFKELNQKELNERSEVTPGNAVPDKEQKLITPRHFKVSERRKKIHIQRVAARKNPDVLKSSLSEMTLFGTNTRTPLSSLDTFPKITLADRNTLCDFSKALKKLNIKLLIKGTFVLHCALTSQGENPLANPGDLDLEIICFKEQINNVVKLAEKYQFDKLIKSNSNYKCLGFNAEIKCQLTISHEVIFSKDPFPLTRARLQLLENGYITPYMGLMKLNSFCQHKLFSLDLSFIHNVSHLIAINEMPICILTRLLKYDKNYHLDPVAQSFLNNENNCTEQFFNELYQVSPNYLYMEILQLIKNEQLANPKAQIFLNLFLQTIISKIDHTISREDSIKLTHKTHAKIIEYYENTGKNNFCKMCPSDWMRATLEFSLITTWLAESPDLIPAFSMTLHALTHVSKPVHQKFRPTF